MKAMYLRVSIAHCVQVLEFIIQVYVCVVGKLHGLGLLSHLVTFHSISLKNENFGDTFNRPIERAHRRLPSRRS